MSWVGLMIGLPLAGLKMLLVDIIKRHRFDLSLDRQRQVDGHLVAVEVGVEPLANQGVNPDRVAFDQDRLERLDTHPVQGRRSVEENRVILDHLFEDIPNLFDLPLEHFLGRLDRVGMPQLAESRRMMNGWNSSSAIFFGKPALVEAKVGTDHDHRPGRVVNSLAQEVLAEPALLALDHVGERLERTIARTKDRPLAAVVVEQGVDRLLEHPLLVADDDLGRVEVDQLLEPVVPVDDPAVEVVQVAGGEVAAIEQDERTKVGRDDRDALQDHPLGPVVGVSERLDDLEPLGQVLHLLLAGGLGQLLAELLRQSNEVEPGQELPDGVGSHVGLEGVAELLSGLAEVFLGQELPLLQRGHRRGRRRRSPGSR